MQKRKIDDRQTAKLPRYNCWNLLHNLSTIEQCMVTLLNMRKPQGWKRHWKFSFNLLFCLAININKNAHFRQWNSFSPVSWILRLWQYTANILIRYHHSNSLKSKFIARIKQKIFNYKLLFFKLTSQFTRDSRLDWDSKKSTSRINWNSTSQNTPL